MKGKPIEKETGQNEVLLHVPYSPWQERCISLKSRNRRRGEGVVKPKRDYFREKQTRKDIFLIFWGGGGGGTVLDFKGFQLQFLFNIGLSL